jgi:hypothetical protein
MAFNDLDRYAYALEAMEAVVNFIAQRAREREGTGTLPCPQCKAHGIEGVLRYAFHRRPGRGRHRLTYSAICETTEQCISFRGH